MNHLQQILIPVHQQQFQSLLGNINNWSGRIGVRVGSGTHLETRDSDIDSSITMDD